MKEVWKDIKGYEGKYEVSNLGNIKSLSRKIWNRFDFFTSKEKILNKRYDKKGYIAVMLYNNDVAKSCKVHRLVAQAFIPNPENKPQINHVDCNKQNNSVENLEWCTNQENQTHARKNNLYTSQAGILNKTSKKVIQYDLNNNIVGTWDCINDAKRFYKLRGSHIGDVCRNTRKTACGFKWKYKE